MSMEIEEKKVTKNVKKIVEMVGKLEAPEFVGLCGLLGVKVYDEVAPTGKNDDDFVPVSAAVQPPKSEDSTEEFQKLESRPPEAPSTKRETAEENKERNSDIVMRPAEILLPEVIDKIAQLNRIQRRNLEKILKSAVKGR